MFLDPFFFCDIATLKQISPLQTQVVKCVARNCDGCVKFVLKLCYRQHILTDCNKCKRLSARAIDYMRRVHCSGRQGRRATEVLDNVVLQLCCRQQYVTQVVANVRGSEATEVLDNVL